MVNLPEASANAVENEATQIEIIVSREGNYAINGRTLINSRIETLIRGLELESDGDRNLPIILIADADATHQSVITAMDAIGRSGFVRLNIATQEPQNQEQITPLQNNF